MQWSERTKIAFEMTSHQPEARELFGLLAFSFIVSLSIFLQYVLREKSSKARLLIISSKNVSDFD